MASAIYLDYNSTTPILPEVLEEMMPYLKGNYGNASSRTHKFGWDANDAIKIARGKVAELLNAKPDEITFNSGSTEGINFLIKGAYDENSQKGNHIITVKTEHKAVIDVCDYLVDKGANVTYLDVDESGLINLKELEENINDQTILICVMFANNETGVIQNISEIGEIASKNNILFMTDATQAIGKIPVDVKKYNIDLLTLSAHKIGGPKGVGAVYVKRKYPRIKIAPLLHGGGHEKGLRSGTLNVPGIVGLGKASELAMKTQLDYFNSCIKKRDFLESELLKINGVEINGIHTDRLPNTTNLFIENVDAEALIMKVREKLAIASGSACTSSNVLPSHVIMAMYNNENRAYSSIRISIHSDTNLSDIKNVCEILNNQIISILRLNLT